MQLTAEFQTPVLFQIAQDLCRFRVLWTWLLDRPAAHPKELGAGKKIAALFITIDPERDTPDVLKTYLENFDFRSSG